MTDLGEYTREQLSQLVEYLLFEQQKRKETRTEISGELNDLVNSQIDPQAVYSGKDCLEALAKLPSLLKKTVSAELERNRDISFVLFQHIFQQAQSANLTMELNVPDLNSEVLTDEANLFCGQILMNKDKIAANKLSTASAAAQPKETEEEIAAMKKEIEALKAENEKFKNQLKTAKREWPQLKETSELLKVRNAELHDLQKKVEGK